MRRAVAACTSPEVFFNNTGDVAANEGTYSSDPLGLAMEALDMSGPQ